MFFLKIENSGFFLLLFPLLLEESFTSFGEGLLDLFHLDIGLFLVVFKGVFIVVLVFDLLGLKIKDLIIHQRNFLLFLVDLFFKYIFFLSELGIDFFQVWDIRLESFNLAQELLPFLLQ